MSLHVPFACLLLVFSSANQQSVRSYPNAELLIEAAELQAKSDKVKDARAILDARSKKAYDEGHVPGALWVNVAQWKEEFASNRKPDAWAQRLGSMGLRPKSQIVIYDDAMSKNAARVWYILRYWGFDDVRLLNGGWKAWKDGDRPTSTDIKTVEKTALELQPVHDRLADKSFVLKVLRDEKHQILDTRSHNEYCGKTKLAKKGGAIPGAIHLEWSDLIDPETQRFKSAPALSKLFAEHGVELDQPIVTHCQSGGRASVMAFGLELMGAKQVRNYYRGWSEWGNASDTPIVIPKE